MTYTVDTTSDASLIACTGAPGDCSLRGAISNAAANGFADTITFDPAIFPVAIPTPTPPPTATPIPTPIPINTVAVDLDPTGNTATNIGAGGAGIDPGDIQSTLDNVVINSTVTFDIVVDSVPSPGIFGIGLEVNYDQTIVKVTATNLTAGLLQFSSGTPSPFGVNDPTPDTDGSFRVDSVDLSATDETGPGKVLEVTVECIATGTTPITLTDTITGGGSFAGILYNLPSFGAFTIGTELEAFIGCGVPVPTPSPTPPPTPTPTPTPAPTPTPTPAPTATTITLGSALPDLSGGNDTIDGTGARVIVDGVSGVFDCFTISGDGNSISGLNQITNCSTGVNITGASNTIGGTNIDNDFDGLFNEDPLDTVDNDGDTVVDEDPLEGGMVISGNTNGVRVFGSGATGNDISGNFIGTDATGTIDLGNSSYGVLITGAPGNTIGGTVAGARNVISGNNLYGVLLFSSASTGNTVAGNFIGTDATGTIDLGNSIYGVGISSAPGNTIGGTTAGARNIISGNDLGGVLILGSGATGNVVEGNYIGADVTGAIDLGNTNYGVDIGAPSNTIGGTVAGARNVISGNNLHGVRIGGSSATGNTVAGNYIGTDATGTIDLGNSSSGVLVTSAAGNTIGGTASGARNVISGNNAYGVYLFSSASTGNKVEGNYIGTDATGTIDLGNSLYGVRVASAPNNTIGGTVASARNVISGNNNTGVLIDGSTATGNKIEGNYIGTNVSGSANLGNTVNGVRIASAPGNTVGGTMAGARNIISGNINTGLAIDGSLATGNTVAGNYIGTDAAGTTALANGTGVRIQAGAQLNTIGGATAGERNVISGNTNSGLLISGTGTNGNTVVGNYIGTDAAGDAAIANGSSGIALSSGTQSNSIGGTASGEGNIIAYNGQTGVCVTDSTGNAIRGNSIHSNTLLGIDLAPPGQVCSNGFVTANDGGDGDTGPNDLMNFPVITSATFDGVNTTISGSLDTIPTPPSTIDVYATDFPDGSGNGEGRVYLGSTTVTTPPATWTLIVSGPPPYAYLSATATDAAGNTSEFSAVPNTDLDGDGFPNLTDNCPADHNSLQIDHDSDGIGDVCDSVVRNRFTVNTSSLVAEFTIPAGQTIPSDSRGFNPWDYEIGSSINTGAVVGDIDLSLTFAAATGTCSIGTSFPDITLLNASTDNSPGNLIDTTDVRLDLNTNGIPDGAEKFPKFLNTILDPERRTNVDEDGDGLTDEDPPGGGNDDGDGFLDEDGVGTPEVPHARYFGEYGGGGFVQVLIFEETANTLYRSQTVFDDPTAASAPGSLVSCAPVEIRITTLDTSVTNTVANPDVLGGDTVLITPVSTGTRVFELQLVDLADADGDGFENLLDNCPLLYNPGQGDADADAIGDLCEPVSGPCSATASTDCDGDGRINAADNCPLVANPSQAESEIRTPRPFGIPQVNDRIGDVCDPNPTLVDDAGSPDIRRFSDAICITGGGVTDTDGDGWCGGIATEDPDDSNAAVTPENDAVAPGSCSNGVDDDAFGGTDAADSDCSDADGDGVPDNVDNCNGTTTPAAANPLQLDADLTTPAGDACEAAIIATLQTVTVTGGANSELRGRLVEPAPKMLHDQSGGVVSITDADWFVAGDGAVPNGAIRAALATTFTITLSPSNTCNSSLPVNFTLLDAATAPTPTVNSGTAFGGLLADVSPANGLPDGVDRMPAFLLDLPRLDDDADGLVDEDPINLLDDDGDGLIDEDPAPLARLFGSAQLAGVTTVLNVLIYSPVPKDNDGDGLVDEDPPDAIDNDLDGLVDEDPQEGYEAVFIAGDPTVTPNGGTISAFCTPFEGRLFRYAVSLDNPGTVADESGTELLANASTGLTELFSTRVITQPDLDGDLIENALDTCVNEPDNDNDGTPDQFDLDPWNPRLVNPPGDPDGNGIPAGCELPPPPAIQVAMLLPAVTACVTSDDCDGDGVDNTADNCLVEANGPLAGLNNQLDTDGDGIGDVCDPNTTLPSGSVQQVVGGTPQCPSPPGIDLDKDGYCADVDPFDADVAGNDKKVPETSAFSTLVCDDDVDNDDDTLIDLDDPGCSDMDNDGVLNQFDNCPRTPNGLSQAGDPGVGNQTDSDGDSAGTGNIGEQPFRRSASGDPEDIPSTVVGEPFRRSDKWGGDACDPDDDNDFLPDGDEPTGCRLDEDCDDDLLGDRAEWQYSTLNTCVLPGCTFEHARGSSACLDPTVFDNRLENHDSPGDSLFTYGEVLIGTDPCSPNPELASDLDMDGYNKGLELYVLKDPDVACGPGAWPPDLLENNSINIFDVLALKAPFGSSLQLAARMPETWPASVDPPATKFDLLPNASVNIFDVLSLKAPFGSSCTP